MLSVSCDRTSANSRIFNPNGALGLRSGTATCLHVEPRKGGRQRVAPVVLRRLQQLVQTPRQPVRALHAAAVQGVETSARVHAEREHASAGGPGVTLAAVPAGVGKRRRACMRRSFASWARRHKSPGVRGPNLGSFLFLLSCCLGCSR